MIGKQKGRGRKKFGLAENAPKSEPIISQECRKAGVKAELIRLKDLKYYSWVHSRLSGVSLRYHCGCSVHLIIPISSIPDFLSYFSAGLIAVIRNDVVPFVGAGAGDKGDHGLGITHVEDFMRHVRFYVNEIAGFVL